MNLFADGTSAATLMTGVGSSTTSYLATFAPIFEVMAGVILATGLIAWLLDIVANRGNPQGDSVRAGIDAILPDDMI